MAFKCYCLKCEAPLYFEEPVPLPQVCEECLFGHGGREYEPQMNPIDDAEFGMKP